MARPRESNIKKEHEKNRAKKKKDKEQKKEDRKANSDKGKKLEEMFAYVDSFGNLMDTPPNPLHKQVVKPEDIQISTAKKEDTVPSVVIRKGRVTFFNNQKGYGFIRDLETQESLFVHINDLENEVKEGDIVTFETERRQKGLNAVRVKLSV